MLMKTRYKKGLHIGAGYEILCNRMENPMKTKKQRLARIVQMDGVDSPITMVVMKRWIWRAYLTYSIIADCTLICGIAYVILS